MTSDVKRRRNFRISLVLVFLVCVGPFIGAWLWYAFMGPPEPDETTNHGELVHPARPLENVELPVIHARDEADRLPAHETGRWTVLLVAANGCDERCQEILWKTRQIRISLGRDLGRVQRVLLTPETTADVAFFEQEHDDLRVLDLDASAVGSYLPQFELDDGVDPATGGRLYIIDPLGNLMMYFPPDFEPDHFMEDMERLLRASQIG